MSDNGTEASAAPEQPTQTPVRPEPRRRERPRARRLVVAIGLIVAILLALGVLARPGARQEAAVVPTAPVRRGDVVVAVTERGGLWAMKPFEIKNEVEGWSTLLEIVDEGTVITEEDVENGKVLVRLDSSGLEEKEARQEIGLLWAEANYRQAEEDHAIRLKQNESDISLAELRVKFARLELKRYLGARLAEAVLEEGFDFSNTGEAPDLGGVARQSLNALEADLLLRREELTRAQETLEWTQKLFEKGYVNRNELQGDELSEKSARIAVEAAEEELRLFRRYTLPKEAEQRHSNYIEELRNLDRVKARAASELAKAETALETRKAKFDLEKERLEKTRTMIEKSVIRATHPGRVLYGGASNPYERRDNPIQEGSSVEENRVLLEIPDPSTLAARINVEETQIDKLRIGQPALVSLEAVPGVVLAGRVARVSPMASAAHAWLNPDKRVYEVEVAVDEVPEHFISGMSATAQIIVANLQDVLHVPAPAVTQYKGHSFCWVSTSEGPQLRHIVTGGASDRFMEVKEGLREGEEVFLAPPEEVDEQRLDEHVRRLEEAEGGPAGRAGEQPGRGPRPGRSR
jgi:multidrug resistance efflux pump